MKGELGILTLPQNVLVEKVLVYTESIFAELLLWAT